MTLFYSVRSLQKKRAGLISFAIQDSFFAGVMDDLTDFGYEISFHILGGVGAYQPLSLSTERLDTLEKQMQFTRGFWSRIETGEMKAKMRFSALMGSAVTAHSFLHEIMHFYQDMHGLYMVPLQEQGVFPVILEARSTITSILFCEAWAEVEAIRTCWALKEKGDARGWRGAVTSPDWSVLAQSYDIDLQSGMDEARAAARVFQSWYAGKYRVFYERHALDIYNINFDRFKLGAGAVSDVDIRERLRCLTLPDILSKIPPQDRPNYFSQIDWDDALYTQIISRDVHDAVTEIETMYKAANSNITDIKCGSPPYIWNKLRIEQIKTSEVPPH